jgi:uncharacterized protein (DUF2062 family)
MKPIHWRRSRFGSYLRRLPRAKHLRGTWIHRLFGDRLFASELWQPSRRAFAVGLTAGAFFAMMPPLPVQMLLAALAALFLRGNVPAALAGTWISNPFTAPFCIYFQYRIGCLLTGCEPLKWGSSDLLASLKAAPLPYLVGVLPAAAIVAAVTYPVSFVLWDWTTARIEAARHRRLARKPSVVEK